MYYHYKNKAAAQAIAYQDSIAFNAITETTTGSATSHDLGHTTSGENRLLVVGIFVANSGDILTGATYNGASLTFPTTAKKINSPTGSSIYLGYLIAPTTGANTLTVNLSTAAACRIHCASYTGANQTEQFDAIATNTNTGTSITGTVTTLKNNSWTVMIGRNDVGNYAAGTGTTLRGTASNSNLFDSNAAVTPAGSDSLIGTSASANHSAIISTIIPLTT